MFPSTLYSFTERLSKHVISALLQKGFSVGALGQGLDTAIVKTHSLPIGTVIRDGEKGEAPQVFSTEDSLSIN